MKRKGFTIAAIAVMLTMFMLSSVNASRSADLNKVLINLRNLSIAAMTYYSQNTGKDFTGGSTADVINITEQVKPYMSNITAMQDSENYYICIRTKDNPKYSWWAGYNVNNSGRWSTEEDALAARLASRAKSLNLRQSDNTNSPPSFKDSKTSSTYYYTYSKEKSPKCVWMLIRTGK